MDIAKVLAKQEGLIDGISDYLELLAEKGYFDRAGDEIKKAVQHLDEAVLALRGVQQRLEKG